eukprot:g67892.t1
MADQRAANLATMRLITADRGLLIKTQRMIADHSIADRGWLIEAGENQLRQIDASRGQSRPVEVERG